MRAERRRRVVRVWSAANRRAEEPVSAPRPFDPPKQMVGSADERVKANKGAAGVDDQSIAAFEADLKGNLDKRWNRMASGSYVPPPVKAVELSKKDGSGTRTLGVPTVADRIAQTVVARYLGPRVEPGFHPDSSGYRPGRSALDGVGSAGSGAGGATGCSIWTAGPSSTRCRGS
jgi:RNA-directed DNA polymerase